MSDKETVDLEQVTKSLAALQASVQKGHSSKGTNTTAVESMTGEGSATQIFHTASNSDPGSWAGSTARDVPENGATDSVEENGTDYNNQGQMVKSIWDKVQKGIPLTAHEASVLKGFMPFEKKDDKDSDKDDAKKAASTKKGDLSIEHEDDDDMDKAITDKVESDEEVEKGFEVTDFLKSWSAAMTKSIDSRFDRLERGLMSVSTQVSSTSDVQKSLGNALSNVGATVVDTYARIAELEGGAARAPKAATSVQPIQKGGFSGSEDIISKAISGDRGAQSIVADTLCELVQKGVATANDVVLYESTGQLTPSMANKVRELRS